MLPSESCDQPGVSPGMPSPPIRSCSGWGLHVRPVTRPPVSSYLTISPLPFLRRAVCFCCTFRRVTPPGRYPAPRLVEFGLSSPIIIGAITRPAWLILMYTLSGDRSNNSAQVQYASAVAAGDNGTAFYPLQLAYREHHPATQASPLLHFYYSLPFSFLNIFIRG